MYKIMVAQALHGVSQFKQFCCMKKPLVWLCSVGECSHMCACLYYHVRILCIVPDMVE